VLLLLGCCVRFAVLLRSLLVFAVGPTNTAGTGYQFIEADEWPNWGSGSGYTHDLRIGTILGADAQVDGAGGSCYQGHAYHGTTGEICGTRYDGLDGGWGATEVEVWRPR